MAILERWDDERAGGPALLRACGLTAEQAGQIAATLLPAADAGVADPGEEPRVIGGLRFVLDQAERIAAEARAPYVGTEHLVVAILWLDAHIAAGSCAATASTTPGRGSRWPVRQAPRRPGVVAGAHPSRCVGP